MDYPFYLRKLTQLDQPTLDLCCKLLDENDVIKHPHFTSPERNQLAYKQVSPNVQKVVDIIAEKLKAVLPVGNLYWSEINQLAPQGILGEHSDLAYAGYNREVGMPMEIVLTHKIHVHFKGEAALRFRRSKYEPKTEFNPKPGEIFWYNNYVWHESENIGDTNRLALSLIYWDKHWKIKGALFERAGLKYQDCYQL